MSRVAISYPGAKGRLAPTLVSMMPSEGRVYLEPFAGRGNVFFAAAPVLKFQEWRINDIATDKFFEAIVCTGGRIRVPERTREEFIKQKHRFYNGDPRAVLLEPYLTFAGGGYKKGGFGNLKGVCAKNYSKTLRHCAELLRYTQAHITGYDWKYLGLDTLDSSDFVFLDPPYIGGDVRAYSSDFDFVGLVDALTKARFKWLLTEYEQDLYHQAFGRPSYTASVQLQCDGRGRRRRTECVWKNY